MRLIKTGLVLAACAALIWLSARSAAISALLKQSPAAAALVAPNDPGVILRLAMSEYSQTGGSVSPGLRFATMKALSRAPLAEEPFIIAATAALASNQPRARAILAEAARRNPRSRIAQLLLLDGQLRTGRVEDAATTINLLARLIPDARNILVNQLAQFARDPSTRPALTRVLAGDPRTRESLLEYLAANVEDADLLLGLAGEDGASSRGGSLHVWQQKLLTTLLEQGDVRRAFQLWSRFSGVDPKQAGIQIYDPSFKGLPAPPPFNWDYVETNAGVAESSGGSGLQVQYYGRENARLVEQILILSPGRYRLAARVRDNNSGDAGGLSWRLSCRNSDLVPLELPLKSSTANGSQQGQIVSDTFTIPNGCTAQSLALVGTPAEFPANLDLTVTDLSLEKVS